MTNGESGMTNDEIDIAGGKLPPANLGSLLDFRAMPVMRARADSLG